MTDTFTEQEVRDRISRSPYHQWAGTELVSFAPGVVTIRMPLKPHHLNPQGIVHGGVLAGILDTACGMSLRSLLPRDRSHRTVQISITYLKPGRSGTLSATGRAVHKGRSLGYSEAEVRDDAGRLLARAAATFMTLPATAESNSQP